MTSERIEARTTRRLAAAPERVFDAWLDERTIRTWMASALSEPGLPGDLRRVEVDARVGGTFTFSDMRDEGEAVHWGRYLVIDRPRELAFTWFTSEDEEREDASRVTLTIEPDGGDAAHAPTRRRACEGARPMSSQVSTFLMVTGRTEEATNADLSPFEEASIVRIERIGADERAGTEGSVRLAEGARP